MTWREVFVAHAPTDEQRREFDRNGYLVLPGTLSPAEVDELLGQLDRVTRWHSGFVRSRLTRAVAALPVVRSRIPTKMPLSPGNVEYHNILGQPGFCDLVDHPAVLSLVAGLLGWNVFVYLASLVVNSPVPADTPTEPGPIGWHQDSSRVNVELEGNPRPRLSIKAAYFLTDTRRGHPAPMWIIPGSHVLNDLPADPKAAGAFPLRVAPGTVVVFDRRLWHSASPNLSRDPRVVVFIGYAYRWLRPHDDMATRHLWRRADPVRRQLLDLGCDATSHYSPEDTDVPLKSLWHDTDATPREEPQ